jgi:hypothetical protein
MVSWQALLGPAATRPEWRRAGCCDRSDHDYASTVVSHANSDGLACPKPEKDSELFGSVLGGIEHIHSN